MVIRHVGVLSAARLAGIIYAAFGLIVGAILALISVMTGGLTSMSGQEGQSAWLGLIFGGGALIVFPIFYGVCGLIAATIVTCLYNLLARVVGGLEIDVQ